MEPRFAEASDQVFVAALELLERISVGETGMPAEERSLIKGYIERAEANVERNEEWDLAKYALVSWIDSALEKAPWEGAEFWTNNPLEVEYYYKRTAFCDFFVKAQKAAKMPKKNALEVFYLCVVFGFRGLYGVEDEDRREGERPRDFDLPASIEVWAKETRAGLNLKAGRAPLYDQPRALAGAPPLDSGATLVTSLLVSAFLLAIPVGYLVYRSFN